MSINPIAFLVVGQQGVHIVPLDNQTHLFEKMIDAVPYVMDKIQSMIPNSTGTSQTASIQGIPLNNQNNGNTYS
ncbi:putative spore protein YtfJ [compost metagenome]